MLEREISHRIKTEKALRIAKEKYRNIFVRAVEGIFRSTIDGNFVEINPALARILGFDSPEEALSHNEGRANFADSKQRDTYIGLLKRDKYLNDFEFQVKRKDGSLVWVSESSRLFEEDGEFYVEGVVEDVTRRKICELDLQEKATLDALTGVPNRYLFFDRLESSIAKARRYDEKLALLFVDLDNFKSVNDKFGHHAGDLLLQSVADRLKSRLRSSDTLARLGGDEFCVLLERPTDRNDIQKVADDFVASLTTPFEVDGITCNIGASIGISIFPDDAMIAEELVRRADSAMYKVKEGSCRRSCFYNEEQI